MAEYIKRKDAIEAITDCIRARLYWRTNSYDERQGLNVAMCAIEDVPAADVVKRKRGKWIEFPACLAYKGAYCDTHIVCSACEAVFDILDNDTERFNFCPDCGARMVENDERT